MINLLPLKEKRRRKREQGFKVILIVGVFILSILIVGVLSFLAIELYLDNQLEYQKAMVESNLPRTKQITSLEKEIDTINDILSEFNGFYAQQTPVFRLLDKISSLLPSDTLLESFSYNEKSGKLMISGTAKDVEEAYDFRNILREQDWLDGLVFTLPDWLQAGKISFRAEFNLEK